MPPRPASHDPGADREPTACPESTKESPLSFFSLACALEQSTKEGERLTRERHASSCTRRTSPAARSSSTRSTRRVASRRAWSQRCAARPTRPARHVRGVRLHDGILARRRPQSRRDYPLNLSILLSGGKETNQDFLSSGERTGKSPAPNPAVPPQGNVVFGRVRLSRGVASRPSPS